MGGRAGERRQIDRAQFVYTIDRVNAIFLDAESVNRANVTESILGYLSCYVSYAIIKTHYEKVRASCFLSARVPAPSALIRVSAYRRVACGTGSLRSAWTSWPPSWTSRTRRSTAPQALSSSIPCGTGFKVYVVVARDRHRGGAVEEPDA